MDLSREHIIHNLKTLQEFPTVLTIPTRHRLLDEIWIFIERLEEVRDKWYEEAKRGAELKEDVRLLIKYIKNGENKKAHLQMLVVESHL